MIYGYIRISTDKQNQENQKFEIIEFAKKNNIHIDKWIEETISSQKNLEERKLGKLIKKLKKDDILIASEISRIGRNLLQIMSVLHYCLNIGCK
ncbi:MAG: recombinase family protein, partial [Alphaproteobacteria bacterium]|nr:recombinase family protein [Alphaproteobacteria bacterium]